MIQRARAIRALGRLAAAAGLAVLLLPAAVIGQETSTEEDFRSRVEQAHDLAAASTTQVETAGEASSVASRVSALLPGSERVVVDGRTVTVDESVARALAAKLAAAKTPEDRRATAEQLVEHLASMRVALGEPGGTFREDPAALEELLTGRESPRTNFVQELMRRFLEWLASLFENVNIEPSEGGDLIVKLVLWALAIGLAALVTWLAVRAVRARRERGTGEDAEPDVREPVVAAAEGLPEDPRSYAARLAAEGRYRDAVRVLFGGAARELVRHGLVRQTRTLTNRELLRAVRPSSPAAFAHLGPLAADFEVAWYGHVDPGNPGFERAASAYDQVLVAARAFGPAAGGGMP